MRSTFVSYICWLLCFVGLCGIHRIYNGRVLTGLLWLFTGGLLLVGQLIDLFLIPGMVERGNTRARLDRLEGSPARV
ncbi:MAG: NINE protein [Phycisphaerales bacterium]|nr:NINE protein [Phycisphaerales bacterium]